MDIILDNLPSSDEIRKTGPGLGAWLHGMMASQAQKLQTSSTVGVPGKLNRDVLRTELD